MVQIVERALAENSALRKGIILQQLPRNDFSHLANLTVFYNTTLQQLVAASPFHRQLAVVGHPALALTTEAKTPALFGHPSSPRSDGTHRQCPDRPQVRRAGSGGWLENARPAGRRQTPALGKLQPGAADRKHVPFFKSIGGEEDPSEWFQHDSNQVGYETSRSENICSSLSVSGSSSYPDKKINLC